MDIHVRDKWLGIKYLKQPHKPKLFEMADKNGNKVGYRDRAEALADENKQWKEHAPSHNSPLSYTPLINRSTNKPCKRNKVVATYVLGDFTLQEFKAHIKRSKPRKACGPDGIPMDLFKFLSEVNLGRILEFCNSCWNTGTFPEEKTTSFCGQHLQKRNPSNPGNYRPISLLN